MKKMKRCPKCKSFAVAEYDQSHLCNKPTFNIKCKACGYIETASSKEELIDIVNKNWVIDYEERT